jgi:predicted phage terminase large subunit-like protein
LISDVDLDQLKRQLPTLDPSHKRRVLELLEERDRLARLTDAREHFLPFVNMVWPDFIGGAHHQIMAEAFERVARGELKRLIIDMPPRFTKSEFSSWLLPAWFLGRFPKKKIIQTSNTENLAAGFGRRVRNLIDGESLTGEEATGNASAYQQIFPQIHLAQDSKAAAGWHTNFGGEYFAIGVNGKVTGKGADIAIVDDPHSEQEAKQAEHSPEIFDGVYEWYTSGIRQRLQPGGAIIIVVTRWSKRDLVGQLLKQMEKDIAAGVPEGRYDKWEVISLPAILDEGTPTERSMWPGFWPLDELQRTRNALPVQKWQAQYQQNPTSDASAILKREYWRKWGALANELVDKPDACPDPSHLGAWNLNNPPACDYLIGSWDCASTANTRSHPSAYTLWGVFKTEVTDDDDNLDEDGKPLPFRLRKTRIVNNVILLSAFKKRMEFPELKQTAREFYDEDQPDTLLIENKSAGIQLLQEFRRMGLPAEDFSGSSRGTKALPNDKIARANMVVDIFASRYVWAPDTRSAREVIEQCAVFPGDEDDLVDSTVQAMIRFRAGGFIRTANDEPEEQAVRRKRPRYY